MRYHIASLQKSNQECSAVADSVALLKKRDFPEDEVKRFTEMVVRILNSYSEFYGTGTQFRYTISKHLGRVRLRIFLNGPRYNPQADKENTGEGDYDFTMRLLLTDKSPLVTYSNVQDQNIVTAYSAEKSPKEISFKSPLLWAIGLGVICGLICQHLPENISSFLVDGLADPIGSTVLALIAGVTGPVIFLSLITSVTSLGSISKLTDLGFKIMWRFIKCTLFIIAVSLGVSLLFYSVFGSGSVQFSPNQLVTMLLGLIPTNIIAPFLNNNTPQLVILSFVLGAALLLVGDRVANVTAGLRSIQELFRSVMKLVFSLTPVIPFISIFKEVASRKTQIFLDGWEFIAGVFASLVICCLFKLIKVSLRCKIRIPVLLKKTLPVVSLAFSAGSENATLNMQIENSRNNLGINQAFSDFWIPMSHAMFKPRTTIHLVIPPFLIAKAMGMPISQTFLFVLIITVLELSVASSGITGAWTILFAALGLPAEYVGIYVVYKVFTTNIACGGCEFYYILEQIEASCVLDTIDRKCYEESSL